MLKTRHTSGLYGMVGRLTRCLGEILLTWFGRNGEAMKMNHPKALPVCFLTEMWERFGYKILLGLLVFVLLKRFGLTDSQAAEITGGIHRAAVYHFDYCRIYC
ncbi:hypothetical protein BGC07_01740 [Piscirickettsia litoralis]|uniref:Uncharacterized protein n=1 Tax=Piscirickettsia litoralis TaxID=1891921 RepID=A0ABX3A2P4_9GAMM|nr:hypothetical protein BGC07_01740 [Piscirickettsia litoralis]